MFADDITLVEYGNERTGKIGQKSRKRFERLEERLEKESRTLITSFSSFSYSTRMYSRSRSHNMLAGLVKAQGRKGFEYGRTLVVALGPSRRIEAGL